MSKLKRDEMDFYFKKLRKKKNRRKKEYFNYKFQEVGRKKPRT